MKKCPDCHGHGDGGRYRSTCFICNGTGEITEAAFDSYVEREKKHAERTLLCSRVQTHIYRLSDAQLQFILDMGTASAEKKAGAK